MSLNLETSAADSFEKQADHQMDETALRATELQDANMSAWQAIRKYPYACLCILIMVWTLILTAFESQAGGIVISIVQFRKHFGVPLPDGSGWVIEAKWQSAFSGVPIAGQMVGQYFSSELCDRFGKKIIMLGAVLVSFAFIGMEFASTEVNLFLAGKTLNGVVLGLIAPAAVSYVSDISPLVLRGPATALCNTAYSLGPLVCFVINYSLASKPEDDPWAYRAIFAAQWGFSAVALILLVFIPESPTFYVIHGKEEKARKSLIKLMKEEHVADEQIQIIKMTIEEAKHFSEHSSYIDLFKAANWKRSFVSVFPFIVQPNSGVFFTASYTTYYFQLLGYDSAKSFQYTCGAQAISLGGCIASIFLVDRVGRRPGMLWGLGSLIVIDFLIGGLGSAPSNEQATQANVAFMMLYGGVYNVMVGSIAYPIAVENPTSLLRAKTVSLALFSTAAMGMVWSFVLPYIFNPDRANLGGKTMFIFAGLSVLCWVVLYFFQTETAGRTYEEIDELYSSGIKLRHFKSFTTKTGALKNESARYDEKLSVQHEEHTGVLEKADSQV